MPKATQAASSPGLDTGGSHPQPLASQTDVQATELRRLLQTLLGPSKNDEKSIHKRSCSPPFPTSPCAKACFSEISQHPSPKKASLVTLFPTRQPRLHHRRLGFTGSCLMLRKIEIISGGSCTETPSLCTQLERSCTARTFFCPLLMPPLLLFCNNNPGTTGISSRKTAG